MRVDRELHGEITTEKIAIQPSPATSAASLLRSTVTVVMASECQQRSREIYHQPPSGELRQDLEPSMETKNSIATCNASKRTNPTKLLATATNTASSSPATVTSVPSLIVQDGVDRSRPLRGPSANAGHGNRHIRPRATVGIVLAILGTLRDLGPSSTEIEFRDRGDEIGADHKAATIALVPMTDHATLVAVRSPSV
ncbi:hypothetical protein TIFTF001_009450 [Ficus carica]|uniref:Uncharacterized protein n=1 Tax=Ficus carica TaxID=3494 RepID=A0AA87ZUN5_FICCA|nr:hypothetical protein TIFTF001_009450 [Ficus carica]